MPEEPIFTSRAAYHFIGLGGIGMSALARIVHQRGHAVQGSDRSGSLLLDLLKGEGIGVHIGHNASLVKTSMTVVYSSDIQETNEELRMAKSLGVPLLHRSDLLDRLMRGKQPLLVTGTHGKTTTTALLASVLHVAGLHPSFVVGGIVSALNRNGCAGSGDLFVAEADESDGSFLKTRAFGAIVTNLDDDHLNYWGSMALLKEAFGAFFIQTKSHDHLFWCADDAQLKSLTPPGFSYGFSKMADLQITAFEQTDQGVVFDVRFKGVLYQRILLSLFGRHNALNGSAVFGLCLTLGVAEEAIRRAFTQFSGVNRRLELKGEVNRIQIFDDYGHHPVEIAATLTALRERIREKRLIAVFQPHRFTRVQSCFEQFAASFESADEVIMTDIYSAGEEPIEGITSQALYTEMRKKLQDKIRFIPRERLAKETVSISRPFDVILTIGAGDVTQVGPEIGVLLKARRTKLRIALLVGGTSVEHAVSIQSAINVAKGFDPEIYDVRYFGVTRTGYWITGEDSVERLQRGERMLAGVEKFPAQVLAELVASDIAFPVFHGPEGEDGMIQGLLDALQIPYAGCDYRSCALCMHKGWTKQIALMNHIPTAPFLEIDRGAYLQSREEIIQKIVEKFTYPIWIKPVHLGSSIGVSCAHTFSSLQEAIETAFLYDDTILAERHVEGRQIEFGLIGNDFVRIGPPCEILSQGAFVGYGEKYGPSAMPYAIPARLTETETQVGIDLARRTYRAAGCKGLARIDFFVDEGGFYWLNEINPFPGCTDTSAFPKIWASAGVSMGQICDQLSFLAMHRARGQNRIRRV